MIRLIGAAALALIALVAGAPTLARFSFDAERSANLKFYAPLPADQAAMKAHVLFLASDAMKGREAGTPEFDIAAAYVAAQFYAAGLKPGGEENGFYQKVPLLDYRVAKGDLVWSPAGGGAPQSFVSGEDFAPTANPARAETNVNAPVVFVGYGIVAPQYGRDDYAGVDVKGKVVAFFAGAPETYGGEERGFFGQAGIKARFAEQHGAVGAIVLDPPRGLRVATFNSEKASVGGWRTTWAQPDGSGRVDAPGAPVLAFLSAAGSAKLFAGARIGWEQVRAAADSADARFTAEPLPGTLTAAIRTETRPMASENVIGILPGSDPKLKEQVVVLSAHLDHIGIGAPVNGDSINNGAEDNAVGIACLIEEARRFAASGKPPRRTIMFLAVTAEEKGLLGSGYFASFPTVPLKSIVADVNLDMPLITYAFEDMTVFGAGRSTLGAIVRRAVEGVGVGLSPDPMPEEGLFVRSDHFRFVQKGIPSVFLWPGEKGAGKQAWESFLTNNYHKPSDDLTLPLDWAQGVRFVGVNYAIAREIADADERPRWNKGDYFGTLYGGYGAK